MTYRNLAGMHRCQADRHGPRPAVRYKRHGLYHDLTWERYRADALACAAALVEAGINPGERVGLLSENRVEWLVADLGILAAAAVNVPPHAPLTAKQVHFQLGDARVRWLFLSTAEQLQKVLQVRAGLPALKGIVWFDARCRADEAAGLELCSWESFLEHGRRARARTAGELARREAALGPDDLATIMYTSGTTGNPKGVMLTHGNLLSNACSVQAAQALDPAAVVLSWLPYSHIYGRTVDHYVNLAAGTLLCLAESVETVVDNLEEVRPTHLNAVPRVYEKILTAATSADPEETKRRLHEVFGPRMTFLGSGGAPLSRATADAFRAAGVLVLQGYGLTESSPVISFSRATHHKPGTVGLPLPGVEVAIAPDGEVLTRGPHVMKGYWNSPEATAAAIRDGWLHTGDLGQIDADGYLSITGRKKELMVLSSGKKLVPSQLEGLLVADPCIDQAVVHGEGRNFVTALIVPHCENVRQALHARGVKLDHEPDESLAGQPAVHALLRQRIDAALADVASWERVKKFVVLQRPFTVAADELTVSMKLRRNVVLAKYQAELEKLYQE
jgi:long-chain acyl-CoA synthetase